MANDPRRALMEAGIIFAEAHPPDAAGGLDAIHDAPARMSIAAIEAEIEALEMACEMQQAVLRELYLAIDRATFGLRASHSRVARLRGELASREAARASS